MSFYWKKSLFHFTGKKSLFSEHSSFFSPRTINKGKTRVINHCKTRTTIHCWTVTITQGKTSRTSDEIFSSDHKKASTIIFSFSRRVISSTQSMKCRATFLSTPLDRNSPSRPLDVYTHPPTPPIRQLSDLIQGENREHWHRAFILIMSTIHVFLMEIV